MSSTRGGERRGVGGWREGGRKRGGEVRGGGWGMGGMGGREGGRG